MKSRTMTCGRRKTFAASILRFLGPTPILFLLLLTITAKGDLVGLWLFETGSGTNAYDTSGNGKDGVLYNMEGSDWVAPGAGGAPGSSYALDFDGIDEYVLGSDASLPSGTNKTISLWLNGDVLSGDSVLFIYGTGVANQMSYLQVHDVWSFYWDGFAAQSWFVLGAPLAPTTWYHVLVTYDGFNARLYLDSIQALPDLVQPSWNTVLGGQFTIGAWVGGGALRFDGRIDDVAVWDEVLNTTQISNVYNYGAANYNGLPLGQRGALIMGR